jgi:DNA-binding response OmpR family regulator
MSDADRPTVLVVEDEPDVAETYRLWLADGYEVLWAEDGEEALELVGDGVDVVLLDRMMPRMSGDEVLTEIRSRGIDCRVAMVTAVDPDFDIIEMGFDEYVSKPPTRDGLLGTVEALLDRDDYADRVRRYRSLVSKRAALQAEKSITELEASEEYADLEARIAATEEALSAEQDALKDDATFVSAIRDLAGDDRDTDEVDGDGGDGGERGPGGVDGDGGGRET